MPRRDPHLTGVFLGSHAVAAGHLTRDQLRRLGWRRLVRGVYADPGLTHDHRLRARGVSLLLPTGAVIGGHSAAAWYGARFAAAADPVTVICPSDVRWVGPRGVRVHRAPLAPADVTVAGDVPLSSVLRTAWDVAALESLPTAVAALDAMVRTENLVLSHLAAAAEQGSGRWGVVRVRRAVPLVDSRAASPPESWVRVALVLAGLDPTVQFKVFADGSFVARVDFAWPELRLAVEYDGAYHFEDDQIPKDDERIAALRAAGWRVLRISAADLRDMDRVVQRIRDALTDLSAS
ncbi:DUF559 domain-containing protein [Modestobacter altitudinis]|uniref:DUF559 domain-containing protein n=1 Tax=Modestobacter altitudinis TaxID=2213158 RepID=UPI00110CF830|nr:DUF559 domain-containing protein [Modestobacter altitudinis]